MSEIEEKRRKLLEIQARNKNIKNSAAGAAGFSANPNAASKKMYTDIDDLVQGLLKEKTDIPIQKKDDKVEERKHEISSPPKPAKKKKMEMVSFVGEINIGKGINKYDQEIQVELQELASVPTPVRHKKTGDKNIEDFPDALPVVSRLSKIPPQILNEIHSHSVKEVKEEKKSLNQEDLKVIEKSPSFQEFFNKTSKIIERVLEGDDSNIDTLENMISKETVIEKDEDKSDILRHSLKFFDANYSNNRIVTGLEWSPNLDELFLASYGQNDEGSINDPLGVVLLWSLSLKSRPEFYCFCQSPVTSACFYPYSPNRLIGGLYNGTIVIWDLRDKTTPVQRTTLSSGGHTFPIYSLAVVGSQNSNNIVSISNDGKLCLWSMNMLTSPNKVIDLKHKNVDKSATKDNLVDINVTCMAFPETDPNNFYVGSEDGTIYQSQVHGNQAKADNVIESFKEHEAPVTSISVMPQIHDIPPFMQGLTLSSSFDWSVKLWNPKVSNECFLSFDSAEDYVYDVGFNKTNPALFASVDGEGYIDLWDLEGDLEVPLLHYKSGNNSLNKLKWNKDGSKMIVGDAVGNVNLYGLEKRYLKYSNEKLHDLENILTKSK